MSIEYKNAQKNLLNTFVATFFATLLLLLSGIALANQTASVSDVIGHVTITSEGEVRRLKDGDTVKEGDIIKTGDNSSVTLTLSSGELVKLGSSASYTIGQLSYDGAEGVFAKRSFGATSPALSTATSAGGGITENTTPTTPTTPGTGGSPSN